MNHTAKKKKEIGPAAYTVVIFCLIALTLGSYYLSTAHLSSTGELLAALGIAVVKASLVAMFFMHLIEQEVSNQITLLVAAAFVIALLVFVVGDVVTRQVVPLVPPVTVPVP